MAIRMMTTAEKAGQPNVETVLDYPGHTDAPLYLVTTYKGCVLDTYERNGYNDSDFYAIVWNEAEQKIEHVEYATTRGWSYPNGATVDATPEVIAKAQAYRQELHFKKWQEDNKKQAEMPYKGRKVRVLRGRNKGVEGEVFWFGEDQYKARQRARYNRYNPYAGLVGKFFKDRYRVGIKWADQSAFFSAENVEVIDPSQYLENEEVARQQQYVTGWRDY